MFTEVQRVKRQDRGTESSVNLGSPVLVAVTRHTERNIADKVNVNKTN